MGDSYRPTPSDTRRADADVRAPAGGSSCARGVSGREGADFVRMPVGCDNWSCVREDASVERAEERSGVPRCVGELAAKKGGFWEAERRPTSDGGTISFDILYTISGADPAPYARELPFASLPKSAARARIGAPVTEVVSDGVTGFVYVVYIFISRRKSTRRTGSLGIGGVEPPYDVRLVDSNTVSPSKPRLSRGRCTAMLESDSLLPSGKSGFYYHSKMADFSIREDIYGGGPQNNLLRFWLSIDISREMVCGYLLDLLGRRRPA